MTPAERDALRAALRQMFRGTTTGKYLQRYETISPQGWQSVGRPDLAARARQRMMQR